MTAGDELDEFARRGMNAQRAVDRKIAEAIVDADPRSPNHLKAKALNSVDWSKLRVRREPGGDRHYIRDVAIHAGDPIRAFLGGKWVSGRYEAVWHGGRLRDAALYDSEDRGWVLEPDTPVVLFGERS